MLTHQEISNGRRNQPRGLVRRNRLFSEINEGRAAAKASSPAPHFGPQWAKIVWSPRSCNHFVVNVSVVSLALPGPPKLLALIVSGMGVSASRRALPLILHLVAVLSAT